MRDGLFFKKKKKTDETKGSGKLYSTIKRNHSRSSRLRKKSSGASTVSSSTTETSKLSAGIGYTIESSAIAEEEPAKDCDEKPSVTNNTEGNEMRSLKDDKEINAEKNISNGSNIVNVKEVENMDEFGNEKVMDVLGNLSCSSSTKDVNVIDTLETNDAIMPENAQEDDFLDPTNGELIISGERYVVVGANKNGSHNTEKEMLYAKVADSVSKNGCATGENYVDTNEEHDANLGDDNDSLCSETTEHNHSNSNETPNENDLSKERSCFKSKDFDISTAVMEESETTTFTNEICGPNNRTASNICNDEEVLIPHAWSISASSKEIESLVSHGSSSCWATTSVTTASQQRNSSSASMSNLIYHTFDNLSVSSSQNTRKDFAARPVRTEARHITDSSIEISDFVSVDLTGADKRTPADDTTNINFSTFETRDDEHTSIVITEHSECRDDDVRGTDCSMESSKYDSITIEDSQQTTEHRGYVDTEIRGSETPNAPGEDNAMITLKDGQKYVVVDRKTNVFVMNEN